MPVFWQELVRVQILSRRLTSGDEEQMIDEERAWIGEGEYRIDEHSESHALLRSTGQSTSKRHVVAISVDSDMSQAKSN